MPTHPFAIKCAAALEKAKRLRDAARRSKAAAKDDPNAPKTSRSPRGSGRTINLGPFGIGGSPGVVEPGGATKMFQMVPTPALAKLLQELVTEKAKCARAQSSQQYDGHWVDTDAGRQWVKGGTAVNNTSNCPGALRVQKEISKLMDRGGAWVLGRR